MSYKTLAYYKPNGSYMLRLALNLPEAVQYCIKSKCTYMFVIILNIYSAQIYRDYYIRKLKIREVLLKRQLIVVVIKQPTNASRK
jgi:hypothetical protein